MAVSFKAMKQTADFCSKTLLARVEEIPLVPNGVYRIQIDLPEGLPVLADQRASFIIRKTLHQNIKLAVVGPFAYAYTISLEKPKKTDEKQGCVYVNVVVEEQSRLAYCNTVFGRILSVAFDNFVSSTKRKTFSACLVEYIQYKQDQYGDRKSLYVCQTDLSYWLPDMADLDGKPFEEVREYFLTALRTHKFAGFNREKQDTIIRLEKERKDFYHGGLIQVDELRCMQHLKIDGQGKPFTLIKVEGHFNIQSDGTSDVKLLVVFDGSTELKTITVKSESGELPSLSMFSNDVRTK